MKPCVSRPARLLLVTLGTLLVAVGAVGVFVPLLPTTPFLLLAAFLYARSSERFYSWLLGSHWIGRDLRRYYEGREMTSRHKTWTLGLLWSVLVISAALGTSCWWIRGVLGGVGMAVTVHILRLDAGRDRHEPKSDS